MEKIVKARHLDNLEFAQWMKRYFDINDGPRKAENYDPVMRRSGIEPDFSFGETSEKGKGKKEENNVRVSKQEEEVVKNNGKFVKQKKRAYSKSPFSKHQHESSNERKKESFSSKLKDTIMNRFQKDLEEENKYLKNIFNEISSILNEDDGEKKKNGEDYYKNKLGKIEILVKSIDEDLPISKTNNK